MITHQYNDRNDWQKGGAWFGHYGRQIGVWTFDPEARRISVRCGQTTRTFDLPKTSAPEPIEQELRERVLEIATDIAQELSPDRFK